MLSVWDDGLLTYIIQSVINFVYHHRVGASSTCDPENHVWFQNQINWRVARWLQPCKGWTRYIACHHTSILISSTMSSSGQLSADLKLSTRQSPLEEAIYWRCAGFFHYGTTNHGSTTQEPQRYHRQHKAAPCNCKTGPDLLLGLPSLYKRILKEHHAAATSLENSNCRLFKAW